MSEPSPHEPYIDPGLEMPFVYSGKDHDTLEQQAKTWLGKPHPNFHDLRCVAVVPRGRVQSAKIGVPLLKGVLVFWVKVSLLKSQMDAGEELP